VARLKFKKKNYFPLENIANVATWVEILRSKILRPIQVLDIKVNKVEEM
jgi:hypothetical protein